MPEMDACVGLAKGPGDRPHQFTFITPDSDDSLPVGEYVYYALPEGEGELRVICRIDERREARNYPNAFLAHPLVAPGELAGFIGYAEEGDELFELTASVLGYFDPTLGDFMNPRRLPRVGHPIYRAPADLLQSVLNRKRPGEPGGAYIGSLLSRPADEVPIVLDASRFTSTHLAIIAGTGSGKSYLAAVVVEELLRPTNRACVLIVDPHGEYGSLAELSNLEEFHADAQDGLAEYRPQVRVLSPDDVKVAYRSLELDDLRYLLGRDLTAKQSYVLGVAFRNAERVTKGLWTLTDLKNEVANWAHQAASTPEGVGGAAADVDSNAHQTAAALSWRLENVLGRSESRIFDDHRDLALQDLFRPGQCTVLQLSQVSEREQQVVVATILRRLYKARLATEKALSAPGDPTYLPYPAFVILEEAHNFAPAAADLVTSEQLKRILSEGRKFGVGMCLISQRPGRLDPDVLSQCMTQVLLRISNEVDQARVAQSVETVGRSLMDELPGLSKGQAIVAGMAVNTPVLVRVRQRLTRHQAQDPDAPARWREHFRKEELARRQRDEALPLHRPPPSRAELLSQLFGVEDDE
ncbi:MAG: ATP-binding protein [Anaerolineae bacterium]|nr:ATP-binding protein [Anaerolineae bacterium]